MSEASLDVVEGEAVATVKKDDVVDGRLVEQLVGRAREQGLALTGEGGLLGQLTKLVLESALEGEITDGVGRRATPHRTQTVSARTRSGTAATPSGRTGRTSLRNEQAKLAWIVHTDPRLARAYYRKEGLRVIFTLPIDHAGEALDWWVCWARRWRVPAFVKLWRSIVKHRRRPLPRSSTACQTVASNQ